MTDNNIRLTSDFPILDGFRPPREDGTHRVIIDVLGMAEPYLDEADGWVALPVRLVHSPLGGFGIELGPYTLDPADIDVLRRAVAAYDAATVARPEAQR